MPAGVNIMKPEPHLFDSNAQHERVAVLSINQLSVDRLKKPAAGPIARSKKWLFNLAAAVLFT